MSQKLILLLAAVTLAACQTYDFEPVSPLALAQTTQKSQVVARQLKPNLMLLVDTSGSMNDGISGPGSNPKMAEMKTAMGAFLTNNGAVARFGLSSFPEDSQCAPTSHTTMDLPAKSATDDDNALRMQAASVNNSLQALSANGGTPTGASLAFVGNLQGLNYADDSRQDFILLLTDGLPNCNDANPNTQCSPAPPNTECKCTLASAASCLPPSTFCAKGCLDRAGVVDTIKALGDKKIKVIVVGFGADTATGDAPDTLNAMGEAGGFAPACPNYPAVQNECGSGNTCDPATKICTRKFYQANNGTDLGAALAKISAIFGTDPCQYKLDTQPTDARFLAVIVDGVNQPSGPTTWTYSAGIITFTGAICDKIKVATPVAPVSVEVRIVQSL